VTPGIRLYFRSAFTLGTHLTLFLFQTCMICVFSFVAGFIHDALLFQRPLDSPCGLRVFSKVALFPIATGCFLGYCVSSALGRYRTLSGWVWLLPSLWAARMFSRDPTLIRSMFCATNVSEGLIGLLVTAPLCCSLAYSAAAWLAARRTAVQ
jgi:hypothetical protein